MEEFLAGVKTGENLTKGDPRLTLREWFYAQRARERGTVGVETAFAAIGRSWNAFAQSRELSLIKQLFGPTRRSLPIFGFDPDHFSGIEDVAANRIAVAEANLSAAHAANRARQA